MATEETLERRLARCLEPDELEREAARALARALPGATALVNLSDLSVVPRYFANQYELKEWHAGSPIPQALAVSVMDRDELLGFVALRQDPLVRANREVAQRLLLELADLAALPARNARRYAAALELALRDPLTGLFNRRALQAFLEKEIEGAKRYARPLSLLAVDLDHLKTINDRHGHAAGDRSLQLLASLLMQQVRGADIVARVGGDEFTVLLLNTSVADAARLADRLRVALGRARVEIGRQSIELSMSVGVSDLEQARGDAAHLIALADAALYEAKRRGRNRVVRHRERTDEGR